MRRNVGLVLTVGIAFSLAFAANAWAQGAQMVVSPGTVSPGGVVTVTGSGFGIAFGGDIRLSTRDGESLKSFTADSRGRISESVPIPPSQAPGTYLVIATQLTDRGRQRGFTPGRAKLRIVAAAGVAPGGAPGDGPPPGVLLAIIALAALALTTAPLLVRRLRTVDRPLLHGGAERAGEGHS